MFRVISQYHSLSTNLPAKLAVELLFTTYLKKQNGFWSCEGKAHFGLFVNIVSCTYSSFFGRHWLSFKFCSRGSLRMKGWNMVAIKVVIPNLTHACMLFNQKTQCWVFMQKFFCATLVPWSKRDIDHKMVGWRRCLDLAWPQLSIGIFPDGRDADCLQFKHVHIG